MSEDATLFRFLEANRQQDFAELHILRTCTESQVREIQALHTKVAQLKLASNPATVSALQDDLDTLQRDLDHIQTTRPAHASQENASA